MKKQKFSLRRLIFDAACFGFLIVSIFIFSVEPDPIHYSNLHWLLGLGLLGFVAGAILSELFTRFKLRTTGQVLFGSKHHLVDASKGFFSTFSGWQLFITLIALFIVGVVKTRISILDLLDRDGFDGATRLFYDLAHPNLNLLPRAIINIIETIFMAFMATALAIPFAFVLSFFSARNIMRGPFAKVVYVSLRTFFNIVRSIEALIWAIIFSVWVKIGPFAGMLALMVHSIASLTKQYSEMVETVSEGPIEGVQATGANKIQTIWFAIVPQVLLPFISFTVYRWDINVRMATIIGLVGGGGIGTLLIQYQGQAMWREVGCIVLVIAIVVWLLDQASTYIREALK